MPKHRDQFPTATAPSSAFSSSANPDEDWTKISDLAERRRIQNRIAQRNYRKKLKRRLGDLEKKARSSSELLPQIHAETQQQKGQPQNTQQYRRSPEVVHRQLSPPPMEDNLIIPHGFDREGSRTPPLFTYHTYPAPEDIVHPPYPPQPYRPVSSASNEYNYYLGAPVPVTRPSITHFHEAIKREEDTMSLFYMNYQGILAIDIHGSHG